MLHILIDLILFVVPALKHEPSLYFKNINDSLYDSNMLYINLLYV